MVNYCWTYCTFYLKKSQIGLLCFICTAITVPVMRILKMELSYKTVLSNDINNVWI